MHAARPAKINATLGIETSKSREAMPRRALGGWSGFEKVFIAKKPVLPPIAVPDLRIVHNKFQPKQMHPAPQSDQR